jgi:hypothetical protein
MQQLEIVLNAGRPVIRPTADASLPEIPDNWHLDKHFSEGLGLEPVLHLGGDTPGSLSVRLFSPVEPGGAWLVVVADGRYDSIIPAWCADGGIAMMFLSEWATVIQASALSAIETLYDESREDENARACGYRDRADQRASERRKMAIRKPAA